MEQITSPNPAVRKILGQQKADSSAPFRLSGHCLRIEQPEGVLLHHVMTGETLLLAHGEAALLEALPGPVPPTLAELAARWFLRPEGADDMSLTDYVRRIMLHMRKKDEALTNYTIFTTTACNARCFYCFEAGVKTSTMTEGTARAAGKYIAEHCGGKPVKIIWFGGEPLVNARAIDAVTDCLRQCGVEFHTLMHTNGYLFNEALARRAKDVWKLEKVHITLDGTEEVYNQRKDYVHPEGSPYRRVLRNIGLLLDAGVPVTVRLNMDLENEGDLYALTDELAERFAGRPDFGVYNRALAENTGTRPFTYTEEERRALVEKMRRLWIYLREKGIADRKMKQHLGLAVNSCKADDDGSTTITPDGRLGRCPDQCEEGIWGSVFSDEKDEEVLRQWKERNPPEKECAGCAFYPQCAKLKKCVASLAPCSPVDRVRRELMLSDTVLAAYEDWKAAAASTGGR